MKRFKNILAVVDAMQPAGAVLERAVSLAQNNQATLKVVTVAPRVTAGIGMPEGGPISAQLQEAASAASRQHLQREVSAFRSRIPILEQVLVGTAFLEIIREVLRHDHDLVIKAPENPGWLDRLFGSDDMHLLRKCPCPIWLVKEASAQSYQRILAAVDIDQDQPASELAVRHQLNLQILELALSLALSDFAELHVAHVWEAAGERVMRGAFLQRTESEITAYVEQVRQGHDEGLERLLKEVVDTRGGEVVEYLKPRKHLVRGQPRKEIPALAKRIEADLIVMGTVARTGVRGFIIGNTAETILEQIDCSVLAVKPAGFITPISLD